MSYTTGKAYSTNKKYSTTATTGEPFWLLLLNTTGLVSQELRQESLLTPGSAAECTKGKPQQLEGGPSCSLQGNSLRGESME